jgi:hypothetical protein
MNTMTKKEYKKLDAGEKQRILNDFVSREVLYSVSTLMQDIAEDSLLENDIYDHMENFQEDEEHGEYPEIFEYWLVSDYLLNKLRDKGEVVLEDYHGLNIWGRCTTGQAILLDNVIEDIYTENILRDYGTDKQTQ